MRSNTIKTRLAAGETVVNGWLSIGSTYSAEGVGHSGVDSVTVDLQHGMLSFQEALHMLQALSSTPAIPLVRVPDLDPAQIMHLLDAGAYGIICPMISTPEEAEALVSACRYPPFGTRSFGPSRGLLYGGKDYVAEANDTVMVIPMIETAEAVDRIDDILAVEGVDMVYIGPNDLAFAVDGHVGFPRPKSEAAITKIVASAKRHGTPVGIFCSDAKDARARRDQGCALVTPGNDFAHLTRSVAAAVAALSDEEDAAGAQDQPGTGY
ncbi:aldolase/citrate lyase family protein [Marinovum sp. 2_MG-2023]|uniref:HpcH/HpaI aldolase family protein n=1 Tax=unclassified Marinovum TaxID=2647166 RepID=UPI0026E1BFD4|nr:MULTISPECIES: aldolase/citrate lyase family protein [unclassified Marinovum]MDO6729003.1 aldolase/citrate lyase family protein [Marinovum sp. 2_MG-2023]MDO6779370.1 aldolase/citrate lyase family protein [Marinovum sp. 1_MG-2023]